MHMVTKFHYFTDILSEFQERFNLLGDSEDLSEDPTSIQITVARQIQSLLNDCTLSLCLLEFLDSQYSNGPAVNDKKSKHDKPSLTKDTMELFKSQSSVQ